MITYYLISVIYTHKYRSVHRTSKANGLASFRFELVQELKKVTLTVPDLCYDSQHLPLSSPKMLSNHLCIKF